MVVKVEETLEKTRHFKNSDKSKSKKDILRGQRNIRYYERRLSIKNKTHRHVH